MSTPLEPQRWTLNDGIFALQVSLPDLPAFFLQRHLVIEPGLRGLIIDDGRHRGDVGPGVYTLENFLERLRFWRPRQCTALLVRGEDQRLELEVADVPTRESVLVKARVTFGAKLDDPLLFLGNLLGPRREYRVDELLAVVRPFARQALWESIGRHSITELTGPLAQQTVDAALDQALNQGLSRYGLKFGLLQQVTVVHERFDAHRRLEGEAWLLGAELGTRRKLQDLYGEQELLGFRGEQRADELARMRDAADVQRQSHDVDDALKRLAVRRRLREAVLDEKGRRLRETNDWEQLVQEVDTQRLLRQQELTELREAWEHAQSDQVSARRRLAEKLETQHEGEVQLVRQELELNLKRRTTLHAIELTQLTDAEENRRHREQLERADQEWERERRRRTQQWDDECRRRSDEIDLKKKDRAARNQGLADKIGLLEQLNRANAARDQEQLRQLADFQRAQAQIEMAKDDAAAMRKASTIAAMKDASPHVLLAVADAEKAGPLADVLKHEATEATRQAQARAQSEAKNEADAKGREMIEQQAQASDSRAADAREAMNVIKQIAESGFAALGQASAARAGFPGPNPSSPSSHVVVCTHCRSTVLATQAFCGHCGKQL